MKKKTNVIGRPTVYDPEYHIHSMLELAKKGKSVFEMCAEWSISRDTFYNWNKKYKEFSDAYKISRATINAWWIRKGHEMMAMPAREVNTTMYIWMTRNLLGWRDSIEISGQDEDELEFSE